MVLDQGLLHEGPIDRGKGKSLNGKRGDGGEQPVERLRRDRSALSAPPSLPPLPPNPGVPGPLPGSGGWQRLVPDR